MRILQVGPFPPPYGGVERNLVAIRTFLRNRRIPCGVINITRHRPAGVEDVYQPANPLDVMRLLNQGWESPQIRSYIDSHYSQRGPGTNTPLPVA